MRKTLWALLYSYSGNTWLYCIHILGFGLFNFFLGILDCCGFTVTRVRPPRSNTDFSTLINALGFGPWALGIGI